MNNERKEERKREKKEEKREWRRVREKERKIYSHPNWKTFTITKFSNFSMISITCHPFLLGEELKELGRKKRNKQLLRVGCQKKIVKRDRVGEREGTSGIARSDRSNFNRSVEYFGENCPLYLRNKEPFRAIAKWTELQYLSNTVASRKPFLA